MIDKLKAVVRITMRMIIQITTINLKMNDAPGLQTPLDILLYRVFARVYLQGLFRKMPKLPKHPIIPGMFLNEVVLKSLGGFVGTWGLK